MLPSAPTPYCDELLISQGQRWYLRSGFPSGEAGAECFLKAAFDVAAARHFGSLTSCAENVEIASLAGGVMLNARQVRDMHSLEPFWSRFVLEQNDRPNRSNRVPFERTLRYCTTCARHLRRKEGAPGFLRSHNLPGVRACHQHGTNLRVARIRDLLLLGADHADDDGSALPQHVWFAKQAHLVLNYPAVTPRNLVKAALWRGIKANFQVWRSSSDWGWDRDDFRRKLIAEFSSCFLLEQRWKPDLHTDLVGLAPSKSQLFNQFDPIAMIIAARVTHGDVGKLLDEAASLAMHQEADDPVEEWLRWKAVEPRREKRNVAQRKRPGYQGSKVRDAVESLQARKLHRHLYQKRLTEIRATQRQCLARERLPKHAAALFLDAPDGNISGATPMIRPT